MSDGANSQIVQKEVETLDIVQRAQVGSAVATGILALTYVSGYLTATTYLGTFSVSADTSELFRAKYIYIGFEYWLFVAIFGVCFYAANLLAHLFKVPEANEEERKNERENVTKELVGRRLSSDTFLQRARLLRWGGVMALISVVFSFEILLMNSKDFRDYLPLQAIFLLFLSLYQTTFYREYSKESYGWGVLWGIASVRCIRWIYSIFFGSACAVLMLLKASRPILDPYWKLWILFSFGVVLLIPLLFMLKWIHWHFLIFWQLICIILMLGVVPVPHLGVQFKLRVLFCVMGIILTLVTIVEALFVTLGSKHLRWADNLAPARHEVVLFVMAPWYILRAVFHAFAGIGELKRSREYLCQDKYPNHQRIVRRVLWILRRVDSIFIPLLAGGYCLIACLVWMGVYKYDLPIICGDCNLILALVVLSNILLLSRKHQERERDLKIQHEYQEEWKKQHPESTEMPAQEARWVVYMQLIVPVVVLYLVSVLGFAQHIYPFIPVDKAGGNYSKGSPIFIGLNNGSAVCNSAKFSKTIQSGTGFYVIEETTDWLYLAPATPNRTVDWGQGPDCWKWGVFCNKDDAASKMPKAHVPFFRPDVQQVNRLCVASVDSVP